MRGSVRPGGSSGDALGGRQRWMTPSDLDEHEQERPAIPNSEPPTTAIRRTSARRRRTPGAADSANDASTDAPRARRGRGPAPRPWLPAAVAAGAAATISASARRRRSADQSRASRAAGRSGAGPLDRAVAGRATGAAGSLGHGLGGPPGGRARVRRWSAPAAGGKDSTGPAPAGGAARDHLLDSDDPLGGLRSVSAFIQDNLGRSSGSSSIARRRRARRWRASPGAGRPSSTAARGPDPGRGRAEPRGRPRGPPRSGRRGGRRGRPAGRTDARRSRPAGGRRSSGSASSASTRSRTPAATRASPSRCSTPTTTGSSSAASTPAPGRGSTPRRSPPGGPRGPCRTRRPRRSRWRAGRPPDGSRWPTEPLPESADADPAVVTDELSRRSSILGPCPLPAGPPTPSPSIRRRVTRARSATRPRPLEQIPVWAEPIDRSGRAEPRRPRIRRGLDALLGGLNPEQRRAVTHGDGPLLVVAGAGTGKTQVITRRIAWLIATRRARPSEILALTFTDKAAEEMQVRVDQLVPYGYTDTAISTFHAFGDRLIREFALELGLPPDVRVLSRPEAVIFLREHLFDFELDQYRPLGDPTRFLGALATHFSRCKDEDIDPAALPRPRRPRGRRGGAPRRAGRGARRRRRRRARPPPPRSRPRAASSSWPGRTPATRSSWRPSGLHRLRRPGGPGPAARCASRRPPGGEVQAPLPLHPGRRVPGHEPGPGRARRAARRAAPEHHRRRRRRPVDLPVPRRGDQQHPRVPRAHPRRPRMVVLRRNYRSRAPILDGQPPAHPLQRPGPARGPGRDRQAAPRRATRAAGRAAPGRVRLEAFATGAEEADWIAGEIGGRIAAGAAPRDHAVLVRTNAEADAILRSLNMAGIPWRFSGTSGLYARPEVRLLLALPAGGRGPRLERRRVRPGGLRACTASAART